MSLTVFLTKRIEKNGKHELSILLELYTIFKNHWNKSILREKAHFPYKITLSTNIKIRKWKHLFGRKQG